MSEATMITLADAARVMGRLGGLRRAAVLTKDQMSAISRKANRVRWRVHRARRREA